MSAIAINIIKQANVHSQPRLTVSQSLISEIIDITHHSYVYIARAIGISTNTLRNLLTGKVKNPSKVTWNRLFRYYCYVYLLHRQTKLAKSL